MRGELSGLVNPLNRCCLRRPKKKSAHSQLFTHTVFKVPLSFSPPFYNNAYFTHWIMCLVGSGMHVSVTMSVLPGISCGILTEDIWCQGPCQTRWSFHYFSWISFRTRDGNTWELLMTCWHKSNEEECFSAASISYLKQICLWPHSQTCWELFGCLETYMNPSNYSNSLFAYCYREVFYFISTLIKHKTKMTVFHALSPINNFSYQSA